MSIEGATYISELNTANPDGGALAREADDHLRLLKSVLQAQFPNFTAAAVDATVAELNYLVGLTGNIQDQLDSPSFTSPVEIDTGASEALVSFTVTNTGSNGVGALLEGNGVVTPRKYLRVLNGVFEIINSAYSAVLLSLTDAGVLRLNNVIVGPQQQRRTTVTVLTIDDLHQRVRVTGTMTIPASVFAAGDYVYLANPTGTPQTISAGVGLTMGSGGGTAGNFILPAWALATIWFDSPTVAVIDRGVT